jgi:hypothetical protein
VEHDWVGVPRSAGGHTRTHHTDTSTLWGAEAKKKAINTYFTNKAQHQVEEAIAILQAAIGIEPQQADTSALDDEIKALRKENGDLKMEVEVQKAKVEDATAKITDMEAKNALAREALGL